MTVGLLEEFGPRRVMDTPISEASFVGAGVGAAITGMRPVVEILFADFTLLAMDQIINQAAKFRFMIAGKNTPIPFNLELEKASIPQVEDIIAAVRRSVYREGGS